MSDHKPLDELLDDLHGSLVTTIQYYTAILDEVTANKYTPANARIDLENLQFNEGIDIMAILEEISEHEDVAKPETEEEAK